METEISNKIFVKNPTDELRRYCRENLVLPNPAFYKAEQLGKWTGNIPRDIILYETVADGLIIPFGEIRNIWTYIKDAEYKLLFAPIRPYNYQSTIKLYHYQFEATIKALKAKNGVIVMPCGSGKTQTALQIISEIKGRALWLTHTQDLLNQSMERAKSVFDIPISEYGTITGGKVNISKGLTFATVQTMVNIDLQNHKDDWDILIVDECHKAIGSPTKIMQFYKVVTSLNCRYKFGLTATPHRADKLERSMFAILGGVIHEVSKEEVKNNTVPVKVEFVNTGYEPELFNCVVNGDGTLNYAKLVDDLTHNEERYRYVFSSIAMLQEPALVLANRVEYLKRLTKSAGLFGKRCVCLSDASKSRKAKEERKLALQKLNNGELDVIFATYQLAKEGLDVPNLRYLVFATPEKDETTIIQSVGRVARRSEGKQYGTVIDFIDDFGMLKGWSKKRQNIYKKLECVLT